MSEFSGEEPLTPETAVVPGVEEAGDELARVRDELLRSRADLDNWRKAYGRELTRALLDQRKALLREFLPLADDMRRALSALEVEGNDPGAVLKGVEMVHRQLGEALERAGAQPFDAAGTTFDPRLHEAVGTMPGDSGVVVEVVEAGYLCAGEVLRPARVLVGTSERSEAP